MKTPTTALPSPFSLLSSPFSLLPNREVLGARVDYAIPSRMKEGYGINNRIIEEFHGQGVKLILTVDNGISAVEPVDRAPSGGFAKQIEEQEFAHAGDSS